MTQQKHWAIDDLPWDQFDRSKIDPDILRIVKAAAMVEYNASDYAAYLAGVFADDPEFIQAAKDWAIEEVQHGEALGRWARVADPDFDFDEAFGTFRQTIVINTEADASVRGSRCAELVARCMVETGTSSFYSALGAAADEPVLKLICRHIAADELRHYKLFLTYMRRYLDVERLSKFRRIRVSLSRIAETEDDELAFAYYITNHADEPYDRERFHREYMSRAYSYYTNTHVERGVAMIFKACGLDPQGSLFAIVRRIAWWMFERNTRRMRKAAGVEGTRASAAA